MNDLFGLPGSDEKPKNLTPANAAAVKAHEQLIKIHGEAKDERCKNCSHLRVNSYAKKYFKCLQAKVTAGPATDWRANWQACGMFERKSLQV